MKYCIRRMKTKNALVVREVNEDGIKLKAGEIISLIAKIDDLVNSKVLEKIPDEVYQRNKRVIIIPSNTQDGIQSFATFESFETAVRNVLNDLDVINESRAILDAFSLDKNIL